jgi:hypothetical protein
MGLKTTSISANTHMMTPVVPVEVSRYFVPIMKTSNTGDLQNLNMEEISMVV